jgi:hypothetical protein
MWYQCVKNVVSTYCDAVNAQKARGEQNVESFVSLNCAYYFPDQCVAFIPARLATHMMVATKCILVTAHVPVLLRIPVLPLPGCVASSSRARVLIGINWSTSQRNQSKSSLGDGLLTTMSMWWIKNLVLVVTCYNVANAEKASGECGVDCVAQLCTLLPRSVCIRIVSCLQQQVSRRRCRLARAVTGSLPDSHLPV